MTSLLVFNRFFSKNNKLKLSEPIKKQILTMGLEEREKDEMTTASLK